MVSRGRRPLCRDRPRFGAGISNGYPYADRPIRDGVIGNTRHSGCRIWGSSPCPGARDLIVSWLHRRLRRPVPVELEVAALGGDQLVVGALLGDLTVLQHDDSLGLADRG
jgi:hypothetical protein